MNFSSFIFFCMMLVAPAIALGQAAPDLENGERNYYSCSSCHWANGEGSEALGAPAISGMDAEYVARQLRNYRDGIRGNSLEDLYGRQMTLMAATILDDNDINDVAAYIAAMQIESMSGKSAPTLSDYQTCKACHGDKGQGNPALGAPMLAGQQVEYLVRQMRHFKSGLRGSHSQDVHGQQMTPFVQNLTELEMEAIAEHLAGLQR